MPARRPTTWIALAIALAFVVVLVFTGITYRRMAAVRRYDALIAQSHAVRAATHELLNSITEMETGQRGYLITGKPAYLEPYSTALHEIDEEFARLRTLIKDNPEQLQRLDTLEQLVDKKQAQMAATIQVRGDEATLEGFEKARDLLLAGHGKDVMDDIRAIVGQLLMEEEQLELATAAAADSHLTASYRFTIVGNVVALALLVLSGVVAHADRRKRVEAEAQLVASQAELNAIFSSAQDGIITHDQQCRIRLMNPVAAAMLGCDAREAVGRSMLDFVPPRLRAMVAADIDDFVASTDQSRRFERSALREGGAEFPAKGSITKSKIADESLFIQIFSDLSEARASAATIREQAEILEQLPEAIVVCDLDDRITLWNSGAQRLYGRSADEAIGSDAGELLFPNQPQLWQEGKASVLAEGKISQEISQANHQGRDIVIEHRRSLVCDDQGEPVAQLIIILDVSERKQREIREHRSQRMESIGTLAGGIAHDLNNVLTPILMSGKLLKRGGNNQERLADAIVASAERGSKMIKKLLAFAGGEHGGQERIDIHEILSELKEILSHTLPKSIDLQVQCDDQLHSIPGDPTELSQILMNLAINARDAMPQGGRLELTAKNFQVDPQRAAQSDTLAPGPHVLIKVSDTGTGIPPEIVERIFDPFFTTKPQGQGTGLGLATTLGIVRGHGGDISVYSEEGTGTSFSILLPSARLTQTLAEQADEDEIRGSHGETILLVDDEPLILETARTTLESSGYHVKTAGGGAEAVTIYQHDMQHIDVVVLDMMMPGMDAVSTKDRLRAINPAARIIASSGLRRLGSDGGRLLDVDGFLPKPYSDEQLLRIVRRVLDEPRGAAVADEAVATQSQGGILKEIE